MAVLLGKQTTGTTADNIPSGDAAAEKFTASASGQLAVIFAQTKVSNPTLSAVTLGVYADSAGVAAALLGSGAASGFTGTAAFSAAISPTVTIVSGTVYWLAIYAVGEQLDWQIDSSIQYAERTAPGAMPTPNWTSSGTLSGPWTGGWIIWGEDAPVAQVMGPAFQAIPFMEGLSL